MGEQSGGRDRPSYTAPITVVRGEYFTIPTFDLVYVPAVHDRSRTTATLGSYACSSRFVFLKHIYKPVALPPANHVHVSSLSTPTSNPLHFECNTTARTPP